MAGSARTRPRGRPVCVRSFEWALLRPPRPRGVLPPSSSRDAPPPLRPHAPLPHRDPRSGAEPLGVYLSTPMPPTPYWGILCQRSVSPLPRHLGGLSLAQSPVRHPLEPQSTPRASFRNPGLQPGTSSRSRGPQRHPLGTQFTHRLLRCLSGSPGFSTLGITAWNPLGFPLYYHSTLGMPSLVHTSPGRLLESYSHSQHRRDPILAQSPLGNLLES